MNRTDEHTTSELSSFKARLLSELTDIVEQQRRDAPTTDVTALRDAAPRSRVRLPHRAVRLAGVAAMIALAVVVGAPLLGDSPAYAIRQVEGGVIEIEWSTDHRGGEQITADLREYGIEVTIRNTPASPSMVGQIIGLSDPSDVPVGVNLDTNLGEDSVTWRIDPSRLRGPLDLELAVTARAGERYMASAPVFASGEALDGLHCDDAELRADDVAAHLSALGLSAEWSVLKAAPGAAYASETTIDTVPDGEVVWGYAHSDTTVQLTVLADNTPVDPALFFPHVSDLPCAAP